MAEKPSVLERLRLARKVFNNGWTALAPPMQSKAAPFMWPAWRRGQPHWSLIDVTNYISEGWEQNAIIYAAISYKARSARTAPLQAYHGTPEEPERLPPEAPLSRLCQRPNPHQSWEVFAEMAEVYLNLLGNDFVFLDRKKAELPGVPASMHHLRPDRVTIIPSENKRTPGVMGYVYVPEGMSWQDGIPILPEDMVHVKLPNPGDPLEGLGWGLSPIVPLARTADVDNDITDYLKVFFEEGAMPPGLLSTDDVFLTDEDVARMRERWKESYGGVDNWHEPVIMEKGMKYQRLALSFTEMGFEALDSRNESRIAAPFGVPLILLETRGALAAATYSNKEEARKMFWEDTMLPELRLFETQWQYYLNPQDGSFVRYDLSGVPALKKNLPALVDAAYKLWSMGEPRYNAYDIVGLPVQDTSDPTGYIPYLPLSVMPATANIAPPVIIEGQVSRPPQLPAGEDTEAGAPASEEPEEEDRREGKGVEEWARAVMMASAEAVEREIIGTEKSWSPEAKARHWKRFDRIATSWEPKFEAAARQVFEKERRDLLALLSTVKEDAKRKKQTVNWSTYMEQVEEYLNAAGDEWREAFLPLVKGVVTDQGEEWAAMLGMQFNVQNLDAIAWFDSYMFDYWEDDIGLTTRKDIGSALQTAQREGWSVPDMQKSLDSLFNAYIKNDRIDCSAESLSPSERWFCERRPAWRTQMIARTETIKSSNAGTHELFNQWGVKQKQWLTAIDGRERDEHRDANMQIRLQQDAFDVGGEKLMYPGDPSASPHLIINCRCTVLPVLDELEL